MLQREYEWEKVSVDGIDQEVTGSNLVYPTMGRCIESHMLVAEFRILAVEGAW